MVTSNTAERITLYYCQGSSDKVYHSELEPKDGGFVVNFAYGRRGSTLQTGSKTAQPVDYAAAREIYDSLVKEKTSKGYTPGEAGTPYQHTANEDRATGVLPQLLNAIDEAEVEELLTDSHWWAQEKLDGRRVLIRRSDEQVIGINRKGLTIALPQPIVEQARNLGPQQWLMDGEAIGDTYTAFDLLEETSVDLRGQAYSIRLKALYDLLPPNGKAPLRALGTAIGTKHKKALLKSLRQRNAEGIVLKRHDASYAPGRPASGGTALKHKFYATASCIVAGINAGKRSVAIQLCDGEKRVAVGDVTIPAGKPLPGAGEIIEVRFLYAHRGGSLFQPVFLNRRDDLVPADCKLAQLKFRAGPEDDEA